MSGKTQIVEELGYRLLPNLVNRALLANDRAKYLMTLLQTAKAHADHPTDSPPNLKQERLACGLSDASLDTVVDRSEKFPAGRYRIPDAARIHDELVREPATTRRLPRPPRLAAGVPG